MPRIRTIKPEFWDSPGTARASLRGRLFFIALWNWADDWGIGTANSKQLIGFAFPNDDDVTVADFPRLRTEVADCYGVQWYTVDARPYFAIPSWDQHQKNERRAAKRNPTPDQGIPFDAEMHGTSARPHGNAPVGTGEQGNRGTGGVRGETPPPTPFCKRHPEGTEAPCAACKKARIEWEASLEPSKELTVGPVVGRGRMCELHPDWPLDPVCLKCKQIAEEV